jgi:hypothetical protein
MIDRKYLLTRANEYFKDHIYLDETLELIDHCINIANKSSDREIFGDSDELFEDDKNINKSLKRTKYKKFLRDSLNLSDRNTSYFVETFIWKNHVDDVLRWFINYS